LAASFNLPSEKLTPLSCFANLDFNAEFFDSAREALRGSLLIGAYKIESSQIAALDCAANGRWKKLRRRPPR
jgi:hypothetical protein